MFTTEKLKALEERRQLLLAQSEIHRCLILVDLRTAGRSLKWLEPAQRVAQRMRPMIWLVVPAGGFLAASLWRPALRWGVRGLAAWRLIKPWVRRVRLR